MVGLRGYDYPDCDLACTSSPSEVNRIGCLHDPGDWLLQDIFVTARSGGAGWWPSARAYLREGRTCRSWITRVAGRQHVTFGRLANRGSATPAPTPAPLPARGRADGN